MDRRSLLQGIGAAGALAPFPALGAGPSGIDVAIEAHRAAWQLFEKHCSDASEVESAYNDAFESILVPICEMSPYRVKRELRIDGAEELERAIRKAHVDCRSFHQLGASGAGNFSPELETALAAQASISERRCMDALGAAIAEEEARQEAFGLTRARQEWRVMSNDEETKLLVLCAYVPANAREGQAKADYLLAFYARGYDPQPEQIEALLQSIAGREAL